MSVSCDEFSRFHNVQPDNMKIDVEGGELDVLNGARNTLSENNPVIFLPEHSDDLRRLCVSYLEEIGFSDIVPLNADAIDDAAELLFTP